MFQDKVIQNPLIDDEMISDWNAAREFCLNRDGKSTGKVRGRRINSRYLQD